jgi:hypothetical protein
MANLNVLRFSHVDCLWFVVADKIQQSSHAESSTDVDVAALKALVVEIQATFLQHHTSVQELQLQDHNAFSEGGYNASGHGLFDVGVSSMVPREVTSQGISASARKTESLSMLPSAAPCSPLPVSFVGGTLSEGPIVGEVRERLFRRCVKKINRLQTKQAFNAWIANMRR